MLKVKFSNGDSFTLDTRSAALDYALYYGLFIDEIIAYPNPELAKELAKKYPVRKIEAIKQYRNATGSNLVEAKQAIDFAYAELDKAEKEANSPKINTIETRQVVLNLLLHEVLRIGSVEGQIIKALDVDYPEAARLLTEVLKDLKGHYK